MHTTELYEEDELRVYVKHNGDWSGEARIVKEYNQLNGKDKRTFRLPGIVVKRMAAQVAGREIMGELQDVIDDKWEE